MKLFTRPRLMPVGLTRIGDLVATTTKRGDFITSEAEYMDADLRDNRTGVRWVVVHNSVPNETPEEIHQGRDWVMVHTHGVETMPALTMLVVREVLEIDPWSYVRT